MSESTYPCYSSLNDNELAALSKSGDDNAFNELAMRYLNTINFIAHKYSAEGYEQNDFVQEGLLSLLYACRTFDENGNSGFKNYMSVVVERRFISIIRRSNTQKAVPKSALVQLDALGDTLEDLSQTPGIMFSVYIYNMPGIGVRHMSQDYFLDIHFFRMAV